MGLSASRYMVPEEEYERVLKEAISILDKTRTLGRIDLDGIGIRVYNNVWVIEGNDIDRYDVAVVGDIHGDAESLDHILTRTIGSLRIFVGDYVDRGPPEGQVYVLYKVLSLLVNKLPVVPLRGNHEPPPSLKPYPHDYPYALRELYGGYGRHLYELSKELFQRLPHALLVKDRFLVVHAGPPTRRLKDLKEGKITFIEYLGGDTFPPRDEVLEEVLWNDPLPGSGGEDVVNTTRGVGYKWSLTTTINVIQALGIHFIIRGHEWVADGFKVDHNSVITVFSRLGEPYPNRLAAIFYCTSKKLNNIVSTSNIGSRARLFDDCIYRMTKYALVHV